MLPEIYTLKTIPTIGVTEQTIRVSSEHCNRCGNETSWIPQIIYFTVETYSPCDLVTNRTGDVYLISEQLIALLKDANIQGYNTMPIVRFNYSDNLKQEEIELITACKYQYFQITGSGDGPWVNYDEELRCSLCKYPTGPMSESKFHQWSQETLGYIKPKARKVYSDTWKGDDIFCITEPGAPIVTQNVKNILQAAGSLRLETIHNQDKIRRLMPKYAEQLDIRGWYRPVCLELGDAEWVSDVAIF